MYVYMYIDRLTDMNEVMYMYTGEIVSGTVPPLSLHMYILAVLTYLLYLRSCDRPEDAEYTYL